MATVIDEWRADAPTSGRRESNARVIREGRRRQGWTQAGLAVRLGVTPTTISRWERGLALPRNGNVAGLARLLEVPSDVLRRVGADESATAVRVRSAAVRIAYALEHLAVTAFGRQPDRASGQRISP